MSGSSWLTFRSTLERFSKTEPISLSFCIRRHFPGPYLCAGHSLLVSAKLQSWWISKVSFWPQPRFPPRVPCSPHKRRLQVPMKGAGCALLDAGFQRLLLCSRPFLLGSAKDPLPHEAAPARQTAGRWTAECNLPVADGPPHWGDCRCRNSCPANEPSMSYYKAAQVIVCDSDPGQDPGLQSSRLPIRSRQHNVRCGCRTATRHQIRYLIL